MHSRPDSGTCPDIQRTGPALRWLGLLLASSLAVCLGWALAGEDAPPSDAGKKEKEEDPIPPFKCSAWCAFRDYTGYLQATESEAAKQTKPSKTLESRPGSERWGGFVRMGKWLALVIEVQNTTKPKEKLSFSGSMRIRLDPAQESGETGERPYTTRYRQEFEVAPAQSQRYYFSVLCPEFPVNQIEIEIAANGQTFRRQVGVYDLTSRNEDLVVVVSESAGAFRHLIPAQRQQSVESSESPRGRAVAVVQPEELPRRWHDLATANLIIIDGPPRAGFEEAQLEALQAYCQNGGQLLINGGLDPARFKPKDGSRLGLADLAGVVVGQPIALKSLDQVSPPFRPERGEGAEAWEVPALELRPRRDEGTVLEYRNKGQEGWLERLDRPLGLGQVSSFSFSLLDKRLQGWPGSSQIPLDLLALSRAKPLFEFDPPQEVPEASLLEEESPPATQPSASLPGLRERLDESFAKDTPVEVPKKPFLASFLLLYLLAAVPANYLLFGWLKRREIAWLAAPLWAILFTFAAYQLGYMGKLGKLTVTEVSVVEAGEGQGAGIGRTFLCLYAPKPDEYRIDFGPAPAPGRSPSQPFAWSAAPGHLVSPGFHTRGITEELPRLQISDDGQALAIQDLLIHARSTRRLEVVHRADLGEGLRVSLSQEPDSQSRRLDLQNRTPYLLLNAAVVRPAPDGNLQAVALGTLPAGARTQMQIEPQKWEDLNKVFLARAVQFASTPTQDAVNRKNALVEYLQKRLVLYQRPLILAWIDGALLPLRVGGETPGSERGQTLLLVPFSAKEQGRKVQRQIEWPLWTAPDFDLAGADTTWRKLPYKDGKARFGRRGEDALLFLKTVLPGQARGVVNRQLTLNLKLGCLRAGRDGVGPRAPSAFQGQLGAEVRAFAGFRYRWEPVPTTLTTFRVQAGSTQELSLSIPLQSHMIHEDNSVILQFRASGLRVTGTVDSEQLEWTLTIQNPQPGTFQGEGIQH